MTGHTWVAMHTVQASTQQRPVTHWQTRRLRWILDDWKYSLRKLLQKTTFNILSSILFSSSIVTSLMGASCIMGCRQHYLHQLQQIRTAETPVSSSYPPSSSPWTPLLSQRDWLIEGQDSFSDVCPGRCQETSTHTELTKLSCSLSTYRRNPIRLGAGLYSSTCVLWALCCGTCQSAPKACPLSSLPASAAHPGLTIGCARPRSNIRCRRCWTAYPLAM